MLERQAEYIVKAVNSLDTQNAKAMHPDRGAQLRFNAKLQEDLSKTAWADPTTNNWYRNAKGRITQNWSSHTRDYADAVAELKIGDFQFIE